MADLTLPIQTSSLPSGFCPTDYQTMWNGFAAAGFVTFPSTFTGITASATKPTDTTQAWLQLDTLGRPVRIYFFASGAWLSLHPLVSGLTMIWTTALPTMSTFDGGDANPISPISGPMWEVVTTANARIPIGVGTLPSGAVIAVGGTGGQEQVTLDLTNSPAHNHQMFVGSSDGSTGGIREALQTVDNPHAGTAAAYKLNDGAGGDNYVQNTGGDAGGLAVAHDNMPPYLGIYLVRRTARLFFVVP